ncbi:MAG: metalloprotease [Candidatus Thermoplasmatota archaeon]|nr:metalloprotease [Candidatus Thermoplasmatota archaeon]MCL5785884.1 metalloprotease [Candidatus Thermoplasmatota archaeon]
MNFIEPFSRDEVKDIAVAFAVLAAALTILFYGLITRSGLSLEYALSLAVVVALTAFLGHELMHRHLARYFGGYSRFKLWPTGALLALVTSFFGLIFAAPGAVYFSGVFENDRVGKVALAGPVWNISVGTTLFIISVYFVGGLPGYFLYYVGALNLWFGLFNMIPIWMLDGLKVWKWNKEVYLVVMAFAVVMNVIDQFL